MHMSCPKWKLCKWETEQGHVHFRGDWDQDSEDCSLLGDLEAVTFTPSFFEAVRRFRQFCNCEELERWNPVLINLFGFMLSWTTTLSFLETLRKVLVLIKAEHEKPGCRLHFWIVYQSFCKVGVKEQTWWVPSVASRYWVQMWVHVDISNIILLFDLHLWRLESSLGEDMPKSWLLGIITLQYCFQRNGASCFVFATCCMFLWRETTKTDQNSITRPSCKNCERIVPHRLKLGPRHLACPWWVECRPTSKNSLGEIQTLKWAWFNEEVCRDSHGISWSCWAWKRCPSQPFVAEVARWRGFDLLHQIVLHLTWDPPLLSEVKRDADYWSPRTIWPELHVCSAHRGWGSYDRWLGWMLSQKNSSLDFKTSDLSTFGFEMHQ